MRVEAVTDLSVFSELKADWERVYAADPYAQFFLSWSWLRGWLPLLRDPWVILVVRDGRESGRIVAFWPIRIETRVDVGGALRNDIKMAGNHVADYTGFICEPELESRVIAVLGRKLVEMNWTDLHLDNFHGPEHRTRQLLAYFSKSRFTVEVVSRVNKSDGVDNSVCPYAELPATFDDYLASLSANSRQKLRRLLRLLEDGDEYRVTVASKEGGTRDLDILLGFWEKKWSATKKDATKGLVQTNRLMLLRSLELGLLYLPIVWAGDRPLVAMATLVDEAKRSYLFFMTGRDEEFDGPPLGMLLHAYSIRRAIADGMTRYDFLRGNERYKYSFTSTADRIHCFKLRTRSGRNTGDQLDPRTLADALQLTTKLHQAGKLSEAARGYRQILQANPRYGDALHRFGQLLSTAGNHAEAKGIFTQLTRIAPQIPKAWFCLAECCETLGHLVEAENAYRNVAMIEPRFPDIQQRIARTERRPERLGSARSNVRMPAAADHLI